MAITHTYTGGPDKDQTYAGLPAQDLDENTLTGEQLTLLATAVRRGVYSPVYYQPPTASDQPGPKTKDRSKTTDDRSKPGLPATGEGSSETSTESN